MCCWLVVTDLGLVRDNQFAMAVAWMQEVSVPGDADVDDDTHELDDQVCCDAASWTFVFFCNNCLLLFEDSLFCHQLGNIFSHCQAGCVLSIVIIHRKTGSWKMTNNPWEKKKKKSKLTLCSIIYVYIYIYILRKSCHHVVELMVALLLWHEVRMIRFMFYCLGCCWFQGWWGESSGTWRSWRNCFSSGTGPIVPGDFWSHCFHANNLKNEPDNNVLHLHMSDLLLLLKVGSPAFC